MAASRSRSLQLGFLVGFCALSLRPVAPIEAGLDFLLSPARVLAELAGPIVALSSRDVHAAEEELRAREPEELQGRVELFRDQLRFALPQRPDLLHGRTFVPAEVIARRPDDLDRIRVRLESAFGIAPGMPVVRGDVYVGRIAALDPQQPELAEVELVTGAAFAVGAELVAKGASTSVVVGGVIEGERPGSFLLEAKHPGRRDLADGELFVHERWPELEPFGSLAHGFELGSLYVASESDLDRARPDAGSFGVRPRLDYATGLFQLVAVAPDTVPPPGERHALELFEDGRWRRVRILSAGDPSPGREGFKLGSGRWNGVHARAAVAFGVRLVGRVERAGTLTADGMLLGDRGFAVPVVARIEGREEPHVLGRLTSLGRDASTGDVLFSWDAIVPAPGEDAEPAWLFTGAGDFGIPHGLVLGQTELPPGPGPHVLRVLEPVDARRLPEVWVRLAGAEDDAPGSLP